MFGRVAVNAAITSITALSITGCAAGGPAFQDVQFEETPGLTAVYIFRLNKFVDSGSCYEISIDGAPIGVLANGGFLRAEEAPGEHVITVPMLEENILKLQFDLESSKPSYFQFNVSLNGPDKIPESEVLSERSSYSNSKGDMLGYAGELINFTSVIVQVSESHALQELELLRDSSEKVACMATARHKQ